MKKRFERLITANICVVFFLSYIAAYFIHLYALHPIPEQADGSCPDLSAVQAEFPDAVSCSYQNGYVMLEQADGSLEVVRVDWMNDRCRLTNDRQTVAAGYTGEVVFSGFSGFAWEETLEFTDGQITNMHSSGEDSWIHHGNNAEIVYAVAAILFTALETWLVVTVRKGLRL